MTRRTITMCQIGACRQEAEWEVWPDDEKGPDDSIQACGEHLVDCVPCTGYALVTAYHGGAKPILEGVRQWPFADREDEDER